MIAPAASCEAGQFEQLLARALELEALARDRALSCLEKDEAAPPGLIRALRAELAPRGCADVLFEKPAANVARDIADTQLALLIGARLYRSVRDAPLPQPPFDKRAFLEHFQSVLEPRVVAQARAVDQLSQIGPRLIGYPRAVIALEAGLADLRFVDVARSIALPEEMRTDPEVRETYFVALERALEPRVARGRDAALVGLGELSRLGILKDARLSEARRRLSELYAGRRLDSLDGLLVPAMPPLELGTPELRLSARLPAFYALKLLPSLRVEDDKLLRARLEQGVPPAIWLDTEQSASTPALSALALRGLFELGRLYFWSEAFGKMADIAANDEASTLLKAAAEVLARAPRNAALLMMGPTQLPAELRNVEALSRLAERKGALAGHAEFNAAYVRGLAPPADDPEFWLEQAERFERAAKKLSDGQAKTRSLELARAARATEKELKAGRRGNP
jgi:hypothetical protein